MKKIDIEHAVSFTGHRPERLDMSEEKVFSWLDEQIRKAVDDGYTDFITGMQRGVDIWAAELVMKLKEERKDVSIRLFAAVAFRGMENQWEKDWQKRYHAILKASDDITYVSDRPGRAAFFKRNEWMVDRSSKILGVYTGAPGGTKETIIYARNHGKDVILIEDKL